MDVLSYLLLDVDNLETAFDVFFLQLRIGSVKRNRWTWHCLHGRMPSFCTAFLASQHGQNTCARAEIIKPKKKSNSRGDIYIFGAINRLDGHDCNRPRETATHVVHRWQTGYLSPPTAKAFVGEVWRKSGVVVEVAGNVIMCLLIPSLPPSLPQIRSQSTWRQSSKTGERCWRGRCDCSDLHLDAWLAADVWSLAASFL